VSDPRREREVHIEMQALSWQAPIPPPEIVRGYNEVIENGAERLFAQFETEATERRALTRRGQTHNFVIQLVARLFALIFALSALGVAAYALSLGHEIAATVIGGASIAMVVAAFTGVPALLRNRVTQRDPGR
jgi:uncharacterized membrane protein